MHTRMRGVSDTTAVGRQSSATMTDKEKKAHNCFQMFTRVLMNYLETFDTAMHAKAKAEIKRYYEQNEVGGPSLKECLRATVGEKYWKIAVDNLRAILQHKKKKKQEQQSQDLVRRGKEEIAKLRASKDEEIAKLKALKDEEIAKLRALKDEEIASLVGAVGLAVSQEEEIEEKDKEIATLSQSLKRRESELLKEYTTNGFVLEENERLKNELADVQKKVVTIRQEKDTAVAEKEDALKSIASMKADITRKEEELVASIKMILNPVSDDEGEPPSKRARTSTSDTSMEIWDKKPPRMMTRHQNQILNRASEKPIVKFENKVEGFKRCPFPGCNTIGLFTKGCSIVTCRMNMRHNGKFHHFCFYCGKSAVDSADLCNNGVCPHNINEESRKLYQDNLDKATRQAGGAYDVDKV